VNLNCTKNLFYIKTPEGEQLRQRQMQEMQARQQGQGREIWQKYTGETATGYNEKRKDNPKWAKEDEVIRELMDDLQPGSWVLDIPCGTGRFFEFYKEKGWLVKARDMSPDMLVEAGKHLKEIEFDDVKISLLRDDARELKTLEEDNCVDASLMIRLTRWLSKDDCQVAFKQLQRVTRDRIIITARVENHPEARPVELFLDALEDNWELAENREGYEPAYRILMFKRGK